MWGSGATNRGLSGTLVRWNVWRVSGSPAAGAHRLPSLQRSSRGGGGCETSSPFLGTRDPGPSSSSDSGRRGVDVRRASGPRDGGALGLRRFVRFRLRWRGRRWFPMRGSRPPVFVAWDPGVWLHGEHGSAAFWHLVLPIRPFRALWRQWKRAQVVPPVGAWLP